MKGLAREIKGFAHDLRCIVIERRTLENGRTSAIGAFSRSPRGAGRSEACGFPHRTQSQINFTPPPPAPSLGQDRRERRLADLKRTYPGRTVPQAEACAFVRAQSSEIASLGRCTGQATYDRAQFGLLHLFRCFFGRDPLHLTLASLWPLFILAPNLQREDVHFAKYNATVLKALFVCKR